MTRETLGELEHLVLLTVLRLGGEAYSVPVVEHLEELTGREVAQATVFIVLRRLETKKLLRSRFELSGETGRERRYFRLTPVGMKRLRDARETLFRLWDGVGGVLDQT